MGFLGPHDDELLGALHRFALVSVTDANGAIVQVNDAFCALSGYSREELVGNDHRLINSGVHSREFWAEMWRTITAGESWSEEICNRAKDGSLYWVKSIVTPVPGEDGRPVRFVSIRTDITAMKTAERALVESRALFRALTDSSPIGVISMDRLGRPIYTNDRWQEIHGLDVDTALVGGNTSVVHPDDASWFGTEMTRLLASEEDVDLEYRVRRPDTSERIVHLRTRAITGSTGKVTGHVGTVEDVTEQHAALVAMRDAISAADAANRAKTAFLANMSHEIRTPLNAIVGLSHLVEDTAGATSELRDLAARLRTASSALVAVVSDVLDVSKIESGALQLEHVALDLAALLEDAVRLAEPPLIAKGVAVELRIGPDVPRLVRGDPTRLLQVVGNLLANAAKYTEHGAVRVHANLHAVADGERLRIDVSDTGIGVAPDVVARLFQPFVQADSSTTRRFGGTGLGLSIVRELAQLMGGHAELRSTPGSGTTVQIDLPLDPADDDATVEVLGAAIVSPDVSARAHLTDTVRQLGWRPLPVADARELERCANDRWESGLPLDVVLIGDRTPIVAPVAPGGTDAPAIVHVAADASAPHLYDTVARLLLARPRLLRLSAQRRPVPSRADLTGTRVLLADDNQVNREVGAKLLERHGATVRAVGNGQAAIDLLERGVERFDVLLTDLQMPILDGFDTIARLRRTPPHEQLPIIAVTAGALSSERRRALAAGADDVITKPFDPRVLVDKVRHLVAVRAHAASDWPIVAGIDAASARALVDDDVELFRSLLDRVVAAADAAARDLDEPPASATDRAALARRMHQLAGSASVVAAGRLTDAAGSAEAALRDEATTIAVVADRLAEVRVAAAGLVRAAATLPPVAHAVAANAEPALGVGPSRDVLLALVDALRRHDAAAFPLLDELAPAILVTWEALGAAAFVRDVRDYEFERAAAWLDEALTR